MAVNLKNIKRNSSQIIVLSCIPFQIHVIKKIEKNSLTWWERNALEETDASVAMLQLCVVLLLALFDTWNLTFWTNFLPSKSNFSNRNMLIISLRLVTFTRNILRKRKFCKILIADFWHSRDSDNCSKFCFTL